jgi:hypothetical protein
MYGVGGAYGTRGIGKKSAQGFGGKARMKETARKSEAYIGEWDQNRS